MAAGLVALSAGGLGGCGRTARETPRARPPATEPAGRVPAYVERGVHRTFHRLGRVCDRSGAGRRRSLDAVTADFIRWYGAYPADRYALRVDDEPGTMLSAILVLRLELSRCSPGHAARIDAVLPRRIARGLRPLPRARPR